MNSMNIIKYRQEERSRKIGIIKNSIKNAENPDFKKLVLICCKEWNMSARVIKEYINVAKFEIEQEKPAEKLSEQERTILNGNTEDI